MRLKVLQCTVALSLSTKQCSRPLALGAGGYLLPSFHKAYWMGINALNWPDWRWLDPTAGSFGNAVYKHWGNQEPNNDPPLQLCGAGNHSLSYGNAWGWADANCGAKLPFVCKMIPFPDLGDATGGAGARPPSYLSKFTGNMFTLHTTPVTQPQAEAHCISQASHLASFLSVEEQVEVESFFVGSGFLLPLFHQFYWMGLDSNKKDWPRFRWMDRAIPGPSEDNYRHWGKLLPDGVPEPNSQAYCAVANFTTSYGGCAGWCDTDCTRTKAVFMCKKQGNAGCAGRAAAAPDFVGCSRCCSLPHAAPRCVSLRTTIIGCAGTYTTPPTATPTSSMPRMPPSTMHRTYARTAAAIWWPGPPTKSRWAEWASPRPDGSCCHRRCVE
jgi:hypothetical protein